MPQPAPRSPRAFVRTETGGAGLLLAATVAALAWANSPFSGSYAILWEAPIAVEIAGASVGEDLRFWVNDCLMVLFFCVLGLELRREIAIGELTDRRRIALPVIAALAGLALPALLYLGLNPGGEAARGWGIVMATDTAFVLGALALVGPAVPAQLRIFLLSLAVVDDVGVLAAIAAFYPETVSLPALGASVLCVIAALLAGWLSAGRRPAYLAAGLGLWFAMVESGVHPAIGGVVIGALIPTAGGPGPSPRSPNEQLTRSLHPWTSFLVVPLFALANAGVAIDREVVTDALASPVTRGVVAGLVLGKLFGVGAASMVAIHLGLGSLSARVRGPQLWGAAALTGIGFTVSLFVIELAFESEALRDQARLGVLAGSALAVAVGWSIFRLEAAFPGGRPTVNRGRDP